jgi:non-specific serine/threonine protein kinase
MNALLDFSVEMTLDGEKLTRREIEELLRTSNGLALIRGRWIEVDAERLGRVMQYFSEVERQAAANGISFAKAMSMLSGAESGGAFDAASEAEWSSVVAGPWLAETLHDLRSPDGFADVDPPR